MIEQEIMANSVTRKELIKWRSSRRSRSSWSPVKQWFKQKINKNNGFKQKTYICQKKETNKLEQETQRTSSRRSRSSWSPASLLRLPDFTIISSSSSSNSSNSSSSSSSSSIVSVSICISINVIISSRRSRS